MLRWETLNRGQWSPIGIKVFRLDDPIASSMLVVMAVVGLAVVIELIFAYVIVLNKFGGDVIWMALLVLYVAVILIFAALVFGSHLITRKWATDFAETLLTAEAGIDFYPAKLAASNSADHETAAG